MIKVYGDLFKCLEAERLQYCSWKNNHLLSKELDGEGDIDLLVNPLQRHDFERILKSSGFIFVKSSITEYPFICHYFCYDAASTSFAHLHVYYKLITGDSHLKQYRFPIEKELLSSSFLNEFGVREASHKSQLMLYMVRKHIKSSSILGQFLWLRESDDYNSEYQYLSNHLSIRGEKVFPLDLFRSGIHCLNQNYSLITYFKLKIFMNGWHRGVGFIERVRQLFIRVFNKFFYRRKKCLNGSIISVVGLDGCGKSTAVQMINDWLGSEFTTRIFHLGRPPVTLITFPVRIGLYIRNKITNSPAVASLKDTSKKTDLSLIAKIRYVALAYERRVLLGKAHKFTLAGGIAILDRYPSISLGKMDSPRVSTVKADGRPCKLGLIEAFLYNSMPCSDLILQLQADVDVAVARNEERIKKDKETEEEIRLRFKLNNCLEYRSLSNIDVDANQCLSSVHSELRYLVWKHLVATN